MPVLDVQPVLDKLQALNMLGGKWYITAELVLNPSGDGAVLLRDTLENKIVAAVDFDSGDDMLEAVDRLAIKAGEVRAS